MTPWDLARTLRTWPVASQQQACRNALVATTALNQQRYERRELDTVVRRAAARREARLARNARTA
jgi:hypothetical protein